MKTVLWLGVVALMAGGDAAKAGEESREEKLARLVVRASGGEHWPLIEAVEFHFHMSREGRPTLSARHRWEVEAGTVTVSWQDNTVTVNLPQPGTNALERAAHRRWIHDSAWLFVPLRLRDAGVWLIHEGRQELGGKLYEVLHVTFEEGGPSTEAEYRLYIDPSTHLVRFGEYLPAGEDKLGGTWDNYQDFGGLKLATEHQLGDGRIWFTDIRVRRKSERPGSAH